MLSNMSEILNFLIVADVSGSMYGQKIAAVNASLSECIAELKEINSNDQYDIKVTVASFADTMEIHKLNAALDDIGAISMKVEPHTNGFYRITSYNCLYSGLQNIISNNLMPDGKNGKNTYIFLYTDAMPIDAKDYDAAYESILKNDTYKNAVKYVGYVVEDGSYMDDKSDMFNKETVRFVDHQAANIVNVSDLSTEINKLQMTLLCSATSADDQAKYDQIFV